MSFLANKLAADSGVTPSVAASLLHKWSVEMRALLLGVVGVVLAGGVAEAASSSCLETRATLVAVDHKWAGYDYSVKNPKLIDQKFRVLGRSAGPVPRTENMVLASSGKTYVVRSEWTPRTTGTLYTSTEGRRKLHARLPPQKVSVGNFPVMAVFSGPLKGLSLEVQSCP